MEALQNESLDMKKILFAMFPKLFGKERTEIREEKISSDEELKDFSEKAAIFSNNFEDLVSEADRIKIKNFKKDIAPVVYSHDSKSLLNALNVVEGRGKELLDNYRYVVKEAQEITKEPLSTSTNLQIMDDISQSRAELLWLVYNVASNNLDTNSSFLDSSLETKSMVVSVGPDGKPNVEGEDFDKLPPPVQEAILKILKKRGGIEGLDGFDFGG